MSGTANKFAAFDAHDDEPPKAAPAPKKTEPTGDKDKAKPTGGGGSSNKGGRGGGAREGYNKGGRGRDYDRHSGTGRG